MLWVAIVLVAILFLYLVRSILLPFGIGFFVAALVDPAIRKLRLRGFSRTSAVLTVFFGFFVLAGLVIGFTAPIIGNQVGNIQKTATDFFNNTLFPPTKVENFLGDSQVKARMVAFNYPTKTVEFKNWINDRDKSDSEYVAFFDRFSGDLQKYQLPDTRSELRKNMDSASEEGPIDKWLRNNAELLLRFGLPTTREGWEERIKLEEKVNEISQSALGGAARIIEYLISSIVLLMLTPLVTLLILLDYDNYRRKMLTWIPPTIRPAAQDLMGDIGEVLSKYLRGLTLSVLIFSTAMAILLSLLGVPFGLFLAVLLGIFYLVPFLGGIFSAAALLLACVSKGTSSTLLFQMPSQGSYIALVLILFSVYFVIHDQVIHPRIVGKSVGLNPVVSMFVVFSGGALFGLPGMILAFPIAGTVKVILDRLIRYTTTTHETTHIPRIPKRHQA